MHQIFKTEFMSNVLQITPRLWQLKMGMVNSFLLKTDDGLLMIDAGWPNKTEKIFAAVRESGHIDHAGSAAEVRRRTGARTYAHSIDLELINKGEAERPGTTVTPGFIPTI